MLKLISCVSLCLSFPLVLNAEDDLRQAINKGDVAVVKAMLEERPELLNEPISVYSSPLACVISEKKHAMLRLLLEAGADPNSDEAKPLGRAILYHDLESVRILLDAGARIKKAKEHSGDRSTLEIAAGEGQLEIVEELLDRGASVDDGQTLDIAIGYKRWKVVRLLLDRGADPNKGYAFTTAAERAPLEIVKLMLDLGADAKTEGAYGNALAEATGDLEKVKLLVASGANVNGSLRGGIRALHTAAERGNVDVVAFLLDQNADVNALAEGGGDRTPLDFAIIKGRKKVVQQLLVAGAERTLHADVALGNLKEVKTACANGADVNQAFSGDYAPQLIHTAIKFEQTEMLKLLIALGADVDAVMMDESALHLAVEQRSVPLVKILLDAGANANAALFEHGYGMGNLTPLHFIAGEDPRNRKAKRTPESDEVDFVIAKLLLDNGADPTLDSQIGTPLEAAKNHGRKRLLELMQQFKHERASE